MFLSELIDDKSREAYEGVLSRLHKFTVGLVGYLRAATEVCFINKQTHEAHGTVSLVLKLLIEHVDAVSLLTKYGCAVGAVPSVRTIFEIQLMLKYILDDVETRGLMYIVGYAHEQIDYYKKLIPGTNENTFLNQLLINDLYWSNGPTLVENAEVYYRNRITALENMLTKPLYVNINAEWLRVGGRHHWYSLFNGPRSIKQMAKKMREFSRYEFLYSDYCGTTHASNAFKHVGGKHDGGATMRPIRHPDGLQRDLYMTASFVFEVVLALLPKYAPDREESFKDRYVNELKDVFEWIASDKPIIIAPWRGTDL
jgi:hypothetical protein